MERFNHWRGSLTVRLLAGAGGVVAVMVLTMGWLVLDRVSARLRAGFDRELFVLLEAVVASVEVTEDGQIESVRPIRHAPFERPLSGSYWQIALEGTVVQTSRSLWDHALPPPSPDHDGVLVLDLPGPLGQSLRLLERDIRFPDFDRLVHIQVAADQGRLAQDIQELRQLLGIGAGGLGVLLLIGLVIQIRLALRPLTRLSREIVDIRLGQRDHLSEDGPSEIAPLITELNRLVDRNARMLDRARTHVGNLAHALKTPLAALSLAIDQPHPDRTTLRRHWDNVTGQIQHHLARARTAAIDGGIGTATRLQPALLELSDAMGWLLARRGRDLVCECEAIPDDAVVRVERQDLDDMIGNLLDNAGKWARYQIILRAEARPGPHPTICISVCDDGPGLNEDEIEAVLARGVRLDETVPGHGLGLPIVRDLAEIYEGRLAFGRAPEGGLMAMITLPWLNAR